MKIQLVSEIQINVFGSNTGNTPEETISQLQNQLSADKSGNERIPGGNLMS